MGKKTEKEKEQEEAAIRVAQSWVAMRPGCTGQLASGYFTQALDAIKGIEQGKKNAEAAAALEESETD